MFIWGRWCTLRCSDGDERGLFFSLIWEDRWSKSVSYLPCDVSENYTATQHLMIFTYTFSPKKKSIHLQGEKS